MPYFCSQAARKSYFFQANYMLGALNFTRSEDWGPLNDAVNDPLDAVKSYLPYTFFFLKRFFYIKILYSVALLQLLSLSITILRYPKEKSLEKRTDKIRVSQGKEAILN